MVFKCQEDSYLMEFTSKVVTCEKTKEPIIEYGKTSKFEGYAVVLENTILFPAGGGQPHDIGRLNNVEVLQVLRKGDEAVHFTREPVEVGSTVTQQLNWHRRFDHMQQHSGQHLLSAILEQEHNLPTTSWWLGEQECHVELDSAAGPEAALQAAEARCNELIRQARPVVVKMCRKGDEALDEAHTRGLPADCMATIRVVCIEGVDENMCCGTHVANLSYERSVTTAAEGGLPQATHVANLSQLQVIKLLGCEAGKKGKTNLRFVVGDRVLRHFRDMLGRERALTGLLKNEPKKHEELVQKLQKNLKVANRNLQNVLSELAQLEVQRVRRERPNFVFMCKKEATPEFNRAICKALEDEEVFLCLAAEDPDKPGEGQLLMQGPQTHCDALGPQITELLKCKGAFKNGKFQGKAGDLSAAAGTQCNKLLQHYFNNQA